MLGHYNNFPTNIHGFATFTYHTTAQQLQKAIVNVFYQLNQEAHDLRTITKASPANCTLNFELGIAEQDSFNFIDKEELDRLQRTLHQKAREPLQRLDFFCATRYHTTTSNGKRKPLRFDYALVRFTFRANIMELSVAHERGTQRLPIEDMITFLTGRINEQLKKTQMKPLALEYIRTL